LWEAVWPALPYHEHTLHNRVSAARAALGQDDEGAWYFARAAQSRYELSAKVSSDWRRFRHLVEVFDRDGEPGRLEEALSLVRGVPYEDAGRGTYYWAMGGHAMAIQVAVADAACCLAELRLGQGDFGRARSAVDAGIRGAPCDERLYEVSMRVAAGEGGSRAVEAVMEQLLCRVPHDEISDEVAATWRALQPAQRSRASV
ncbi:MAG: hypothetical protein ACRDRT_16630, partial [Pseudonocardiaceae bacterium]